MEQTCHEDRNKMAMLEAKLAAIEKTYQEDHEKHSHQINELQKENALIKDEKRKLARKVDVVEFNVKRLFA